jgi:HK97 family phage major capsid protein
MGSDPDGGYLVPEDFKADLLRVASEDGIIRPFATVLPAGSSPDTAVNIPVLNQAGAASKDFFSGVWFTWCEEGAAKTNKEISIDSIKLEPHEYNAYAVLTDKLIRNAPVMETYVRQVYSRAQVAFEDYYFLRGTGVGQPLGIISSPAYIQAARAVADQIAFADIVAILSQILPGSNKLMWVISRSCLGQIINLADTAGNSIFIQGDATKGISDRLMGYPIKWTFRAPALGTVGDISLIDATYYLIKDGFGPAFDFSKHVYFLENQSVLKMFANVDGQPWLNGTITAEDAATEISPFVGLRAAGA